MTDTPHLTLLTLGRASAEQLATDPAAYQQLHDVTLAPHEATAVAVASASAAMLAASHASVPWVGYMAIEGASRRVVGSYAFKSEPDASGAVEIAYFAFPGEEGRGVATAMATALIELAAATSAVRLIAHTLPERNASCRVLEKVGFTYVSPVMDPADGQVWHWQRST
jgi:[ribosomal protein S5]-alanine N-acetyltransferase